MRTIDEILREAFMEIRKDHNILLENADFDLYWGSLTNITFEAKTIKGSGEDGK